MGDFYLLEQLSRNPQSNLVLGNPYISELARPYPIIGNSGVAQVLLTVCCNIPDLIT